ncbi:MAG TPA: SRPBCC domain-containing protein [Patescibacteria group bacterium]|nr:SRPBCC domain-containing protein [Patescibacteria group bacterium]
MKTDTPITIDTAVNAPIEKVWTCWTEPQHITRWAFASDDWEAPHAENDVRTGGKFLTRMQSKSNPNEGFNFGGVYTNVKPHELIEYDMDENRHVKTVFEDTPQGVKITQTFDPENENTREMQQQGWQSILNNFKKYTEGR